mgnify:CR=1 FL=1
MNILGLHDGHNACAAVISDGVYARYLHGAMGDQHDPEVLDQFRTSTEDLAERALAALEGDHQ